MTTPQQPIGSGFSAASTAEEVIRGIDLTGRTAIVTGGYSALGRETARVLRNAGAEVIVPAREPYPRKGSAGEASTSPSRPDGSARPPRSIDAFAEKFLASGKPLHILVNSAAIMAAPLARDARGYETQFSTNHLGHFQLSTRLLAGAARRPRARTSSRSRPGVTAIRTWSSTIRISSVGRTIPGRATASRRRRTSSSPSRRTNAARPTASSAFSPHPGAIADTGLGKHVSKEALREAGVLDDQDRPIIDPSRNLKTVAQGAATSVWCAVSPARRPGRRLLRECRRRAANHRDRRGHGNGRRGPRTRRQRRHGLCGRQGCGQAAVDAERRPARLSRPVAEVGAAGTRLGSGGAKPRETG